MAGCSRWVAVRPVPNPLRQAERCVRSNAMALTLLVARHKISRLSPRWIEVREPMIVPDISLSNCLSGGELRTVCLKMRFDERTRRQMRCTLAADTHSLLTPCVRVLQKPPPLPRLPHLRDHLFHRLQRYRPPSPPSPFVSHSDTLQVLPAQICCEALVSRRRCSRSSDSVSPTVLLYSISALLRRSSRSSPADGHRRVVVLACTRRCSSCDSCNSSTL